MISFNKIIKLDKIILIFNFFPSKKILVYFFYFVKLSKINSIKKALQTKNKKYNFLKNQNFAWLLICYPRKLFSQNCFKVKQKIE